MYRRSFLSVCFIILASLCPADVITVNWDGSADYTTIQAAINAASDGDEVVVADGTYTGDGNRDIDFLGKTITVRSQNGPADCIIDCQGTEEQPHRGFYFHSGEDANSILEGFTIRGGYCGSGGGVCCLNSSSPMIINCVFSDNTADSYGGGFYCLNISSQILANCSFLGNVAYRGGGACCYRGNLTAVNCIFSGNNASYRGGALYCYSYDEVNVRLTNCTLMGNTAASYGALYSDTENLNITNCILWENGENPIRNADNTLVQYSNIEGGRTGEGNIDVEPLFFDVSSENANDWDLHLQPVSLCIDAGSNEAGGQPVPIDIEGNPRIVDGDNDGVSIVDMGAYEMPLSETPVIWLSETEFEFTAYEGGANPVEQTFEIRNRSGGTLNWQVSEDCDWLTATPENGSSVGEWDQVSLSVDVTGLTFGVYTCEIAIVDTNAFNNPAIVQVVLRVAPVDDYVWVPYEYGTIQAAIDAAADGDEIVIADGIYTGSGNRDIDFLGKAITVRSENGPENCIIDCQGSAEEPHRGFYFHSGEVEESVLDGFTVINGYGTYGNGGAVYVYGGNYGCRPTITNCVFRDNHGQNGGAVYCNAYLSNPTIVNCLFICNTVQGWGGGVHCYGGSVLLQNCTFTGNSAETGGAVSYSDNVYVKIVNSILWQNGEEEIDGYGICAVSYSNVEGGYIGTSNINASPGFINTTSEDSADWDLHLRPESLCIDAGLNTPSWEMPETDIEGNVRITDGDNDGLPVVDMGAYESASSAEPVIRLSSFVLQFHCWLDDEYFDEEVLSIRNGGPGTLNWEIVEDCDWLEVMPDSGSSTGEIDEVVVRADRTALGTGIYECIMLVTSPDAVNSPVAVAVKFTIGDRLDVPGEYLTIQDAINAAADLDAVVIADGIYTGDGNRDIDFLGKAITVRSENGPGSCIIDCQGSRLDEHLGFVFQNGEDPNSVLDGVTIINGWSGSSIRCIDSSPTIRNCVLRNNHGGGIYLSRSNKSVIEYCIIENNRSASVGGGIYGSSSSIVVKGCIIRGNIGGGVYFGYPKDSGNYVLDSCLIAENKSFMNGGGVGSRSSSVVIVNCTIADNIAEHYGGGVSGQAESDIELINCIVWGNRAEFGDQLALTEVAPRGGGDIGGWFDPGSMMRLQYCNVQGGWAEAFVEEKCSIDWGDNIVDSGPDFVLEGDYRLGAGSVCIDAGLAGCSGAATDIDGNARIIDGDDQAVAVIDLGAYEYNPDAPSIGLSRRLVEVSMPVGTIEPHEEIVSIANAGGGTLQWETFEDCQWLSVEPESGICQQETNDFSIRIHPAGLVEGVNQCLITVSAAGAVNSPQMIKVVVKHYRTLLVPDDYEFIRDAVDAANDGDVVIVDDGEYYGYYHIANFQGKGITVRSKNGPANCIFDCGGYGRAFSFISGEGEDSVLSGFTITNAFDYPDDGIIKCENSSPTIQNCVFSNNRPMMGSIFCHNANPTITNCIFSDNESYYGGGAIYCMSGRPVAEHCVFENNRCTNGDSFNYGGGAVLCEYGGIKITDSTFKYNNTNDGGGALFDRYGSVMLLGCVFEENHSYAEGGVLYIREGCLTLEDCSFSENYSGYRGGVMRTSYSKERIEDCSFSGNFSWNSGGAMINSSLSYIKRCGFYNNYSIIGAGGAAMLAWGNMENCVFSGNRASSGGALDASMTVSNCTFVGNIADVEGGAIDSVYKMRNCILWDNLPDQIDYSRNVKYCNVQGGFEGEGNIDIEPDFVKMGSWDDNGTPEDEEDDFWVDGDYRLRWGSPCIDAGDPNFVAEVGQTDFAGSDRLVDGDGDGVAFVDMGAYEFENMPRLYVEPETITFNASGGVIEPAEQVLAIQNVGSGVLGWWLVTGADWLLADSSEGNSSGEVDIVTLSVDTAGMADGLYRCKLRVYSSNKLDSPQTVEVILAVGDSQWLFVPAEYDTIQDAIDVAIGGDTILVMDGTYTGPGNRDIDFGGKAVKVRSLNGPQDCIIDCQADSPEPRRGFMFTSGEDANSVLEGFTIKNGYASPVQIGDYAWSAGGGILCVQSSPTIKNCVLNKNKAGTYGGGIFCYDGSNPLILDCLFFKNVAYYEGGGLNCLECSPVIQSCRFADNYTDNAGGGVSCSTGSALVEGCVFTENESSNSYGTGGFFCRLSDCTIINCVFISNVGTSIFTVESNATISNSIMFRGTGEEIKFYSGEPTVTYCNVDGGWEGVGNIDEFPLFVDYIRGDYHLRWDSPCVDAGDPEFIIDEGQVDIDGEPRVMGGRVDIGADEVGPKQADFTRDGRIDIEDFTVFSRSWDTTPGQENWYILCDLFDDGIIDINDLAAFADDWIWLADWY